MSRHGDRARILQGAADSIFKLVCDQATSAQWAQWLRLPLEHAAATADYDLVKKLLKAGADGRADWRGRGGRSLLHAASEGGNVHAVAALTRAGGGRRAVNAKVPRTGQTPLHLAILRGQEDAARELMMLGADVNAPNIYNKRPLHLAVEGGLVRLANDLLLGGASPNGEGSLGSTAIHLAARRGYDDLVRALIHKGANLNCVDHAGLTPFRSAVYSGRADTVEVFLSAGADVNARTSMHETILHQVAEINKPALIPSLVEAGADIETRTLMGTTPLYIAASNGSCEAMLSLLQLGAKVNAKCYDRRTALHAACRMGQPGTTDLLLRWGADETALTRFGWTPKEIIPDVPAAAEEDRPRLERVSKLMAHVQQDRAWRRRGFLVMCRARSARVPRVVCVWNSMMATGRQLKVHRSHLLERARQDEIEVGVGWRPDSVEGGGARNINSYLGEGEREGASGNFDGVAAWVTTLRDEDMFRTIVRFL
ncbi:unnamed protein product [Scytosiphon promiscuus]